MGHATDLRAFMRQSRDVSMACEDPRGAPPIAHSWPAPTGDHAGVAHRQLDLAPRSSQAEPLDPERAFLAKARTIRLVIACGCADSCSNDDFMNAGLGDGTNWISVRDGSSRSESQGDPLSPMVSGHAKEVR